MPSGPSGTERAREPEIRPNELEPLISSPESFGSKLGRVVPNLAWLLIWTPWLLAVIPYAYLKGPMGPRDTARMFVYIGKLIWYRITRYPGLNDHLEAVGSGNVVLVLMVGLEPNPGAWVDAKVIVGFLTTSIALRGWHLNKRHLEEA